MRGQGVGSRVGGGLAGRSPPGHGSDVRHRLGVPRDGSGRSHRRRRPTAAATVRRAWPGPARTCSSPCPRRSRGSPRPRRRDSPPCRRAPGPRAARRGSCRSAASTCARRSLRRPCSAGSSRSSDPSVALRTDPRPASSRSSGNGSARRTFAARSRSRHALTTTRCSQVVTAASPRKLSAPAERRDQSVLQTVGGGLRVAGRAERHRPEPVAVPGEELTEGLGIAGDVRGEEVGVAAHGVSVHARPPPPARPGSRPGPPGAK